MAALVATLKDHGYNNWVKGGLSLGVARDGIDNFVERNNDNYHQDVMNSLPAGANCRNCSTENVIPCGYNNNFCKFQNRTCNVHDPNDPNKRNQNCPNLVCDSIRLAIIKEHRFKPAWRNIDSQRWCREPWQLAKCFMSQGYESSTSAGDTDFPGLLSVIINNKRFDNVVTDNLSSGNNIFCQARDVRNKILHSADMKLTDQELQDCILVLDHMLSDSKTLAAHPNAISAKVTLDKILNNQINITTEEERQVRALREIELKKQEVLAKIKTEIGDAVEHVREKLKVAKDDINRDMKEALGALNKELTDSKDAIKVERKETIAEVKKELTDAKYVIKVEKVEAIAGVQKELTEAKYVIKVGKAEVQKELTDAKDVIKVGKEEAKKELTEAKDVIKVGKEEVKKELNEAKDVIKVSKAEVKKELTDAKDVFKVGKEEVQKELKEAKNVIKVGKEEAKKELTEAKDVFKVGKEEVQKELQEAKNVFKVVKEEVQKELKEAKDVIKVKKDEAIAGVKKELAVAKEVIKEKTAEAIAAVQTVTQDTYSKKNQDMKTELISRYQQDEQLSAPLFPLVVNDYHKHIEDLYVKPNMKLKDKTINSYKDLFKDDRKKIYVVGDAGLGKTSFCQKMVSTWCRVHRTDTETETVEHASDDVQAKTHTETNLSNTIELPDDDTWNLFDDDFYLFEEFLFFGKNSSSDQDNYFEDQQAMVRFDFLFYISLREVIPEYDVEDMIKDQLLSEEFHEHLPSVLKNEKVLIILDGLDEWSCDSTAKRKQRRLVNKGIPAIRTMTNGTILTTTRPWKLEKIELKSTQIDAKVKLLGIADHSSKKLIHIMLNHLNREKNNHMLMRDFVKELRVRQLKHFMTIPVILKQLICLWHSGKQLGQTKCAIYCQMIELLFELGQIRLNLNPKLRYQEKLDEWSSSSIQLPACFNKSRQCQDHKPLLAGISKVAFYTLLSENQESSLVFRRSQAEIHGMTAEDINICLNIGILSQSSIIKDCMSHKKISFLHKTYQEIFAALFVSVDPTESAHCVQTIQAVCNSEEKCLEMKNMITFISGMSSEITCTLLAHIKSLLGDSLHNTSLQNYMYGCLGEGWRCNHDNRHLQCDTIQIDTIYQPEPLEQLCQANIHHMKTLSIYSCPTAQCLEYLLQVDTLEELNVSSYWPSYSSRTTTSSHISEDNLYSLIQHNTHTLTKLYIPRMTLKSRTKLPVLLYNIQHLSRLSIYFTTMPQQLLDSLQEFQAQRPDIDMIIHNPKILPDTECTHR